jgi:fatty-acyl-CoA synthase
MEDVIARHEGVAEAAVIGMPDLKWGEIPLAVVVAKENARFEDKEIVRLVKGSVDSGVLPREAITLKIRRTGQIDKTSVGKIDKVALRRRFAEP